MEKKLTGKGSAVGGKSTGDRGRHTAGGRSLMPCRRVGQRTLARTASAATRSRTNDPANIQSKNITGSSFRLFLEPRFPGSGWPTCFLPPMNEGKRGFEGQKFAHTASSPSTIRQVWSRGFSLAERISAPTKLQSTCQRWVFECFLRCRWVSVHHGEKQRKAHCQTYLPLPIDGKFVAEYHAPANRQRE